MALTLAVVSLKKLLLKGTDVGRGLFRFLLLLLPDKASSAVIMSSLEAEISEGLTSPAKEWKMVFFPCKNWKIGFSVKTDIGAFISTKINSTIEYTNDTF